jgi:hypothetical protein
MTAVKPLKIERLISISVIEVNTVIGVEVVIFVASVALMVKLGRIQPLLNPKCDENNKYWERS